MECTLTNLFLENDFMLWSWKKNCASMQTHSWMSEYFNIYENLARRTLKCEHAIKYIKTLFNFPVCF